MKSSLEELLRDLQIISKELFLSSWNLVSTTNLNTAFYNTAFGKNTRPFKHRIPPHAGEDRRARCSAGVRRRRHPRAKHAPPGAALRRRVDAPDRAAAARKGGSGLRGQGGCQPTNDRPNSLKKRAPQAGRCPACRRIFKPGSAASRPPRMPHMPGKASSRLFIVRQCWTPSAGNIRHAPYQSGKKTGSFHIYRKIRPYRIKGWKIRYGIRQQRIHLRVASIKRSCFFVSEIIPKPFLLRRVMSLWRGTALWPSESHSGQLGMPLWGEQRGRPSERRGASAKAI